jgi:hypothetical protein
VFDYSAIISVLSNNLVNLRNNPSIIDTSYAIALVLEWNHSFLGVITTFFWFTNVCVTRDKDNNLMV